MILFYGLPPQIYPHGGMSRRIYYIDSIFNTQERVYCYPSQWTGRPVETIPKLEKIEERVSFFNLSFHNPAHNEFFISLLKKSDFLYAHTVHSGQFLYPYYDSGKIITDLHGIAPEEEEMFGYVNRSRFYAAYERTLIQKSYRIIGVTQAMFLHYHKKYGLTADRFLYLPIVPNIEPSEPKKKRSKAKRIIYVGGAQVWQQIPKMLEAVRLLPQDFEFLFLTHDEDAFRQIAEKKGVSSVISLKSCPESDLHKYYAWADYGFCLRKDSPVNRVACPTKLMEYAACGVVPIIESDRIGDFFTAGGEAVRLEDMLRGEYPSPERLDVMSQSNYTVLKRLLSDVRQAEVSLRDMALPVSPLNDAEWEFCFLTSESRAGFFPAVGWWQYGDMTQAEPDICSLRHEVAFFLPHHDEDLHYLLAPMPALVASPCAFASYADGSSKGIPCTFNFIRQDEKLAALSGNNRITVSKEHLEGAVAVNLEIRILALGFCAETLVPFEQTPLHKAKYCVARVDRLIKLEEKMLPLNSCRRALAKKLWSMIKRLRPK